VGVICIRADNVNTFRKYDAFEIPKVSTLAYSFIHSVMAFKKV